MHIEKIDLNLLRLFDAVYSSGNVSRAAERLNLTQPAASQGLSRLRLVMGDALFERVSGGVKPSPRAERMAPAIRTALAMMEQAINEGERFDPVSSRRTFRLHMSDIGECSFLPALMSRLRALAPGLRIETQYLQPSQLADALDNGNLDFAFGFLPQLKGMQSAALLTDRYLVLVRKSNPFARFAQRQKGIKAALEALEYVAVRTHSDTTRILRSLRLEQQLRLTVEHFTALPAIVRETDLAAIMPNEIAWTFPRSEYAIIDPRFPMARFTVSLHWSKRFENEAGNQWFRQTVRDSLQTRGSRTPIADSS